MSWTVSSLRPRPSASAVAALDTGGAPVDGGGAAVEVGAMVKQA